ncbi:hypothetical protein ACVXG7_06200 [Enterobacter hormaechei]
MSAISLSSRIATSSPGPVLGSLLWTGAFLPMSREEMDQLGWDSCDNSSGDGRCVCRSPELWHGDCGRMLEAQGFRVGIDSQPDWNRRLYASRQA